MPATVVLTLVVITAGYSGSYPEMVGVFRIRGGRGHISSPVDGIGGVREPLMLDGLPGRRGGRGRNYRGLLTPH